MGLQTLATVILSAALCADWAVFPVSATTIFPDTVARARMQVEAGDIHGALTTARSMDTLWWRARTLLHISKAQSQSDDSHAAAEVIAEALAAARGIAYDKERDWILGQIVFQKADWGDIHDALDIARGIGGEFERGSALGVIAEAQANAGDISGALNTAGTIAGHMSPAWALVDIAKAQAKTGDPDGAARSIAEATVAARRIADASDRGRELGALPKCRRTWAISMVLWPPSKASRTPITAPGGWATSPKCRQAVATFPVPLPPCRASPMRTTAPLRSSALPRCGRAPVIPTERLKPSPKRWPLPGASKKTGIATECSTASPERRRELDVPF